MSRNQFIGGILFLVASALFFLFVDTDSSTPIAITFMVVGIALVAASRRKKFD